MSLWAQQCACCGAPNALERDHLYGGGRRVRRVDRRTADEGLFQMLCRPCNLSKSDGLYCTLHEGSEMGASTAEKSRAKRVQLNVRVSESMANDLHAQASKQHVPLNDLVIEWLAARLYPSQIPPVLQITHQPVIIRPASQPQSWWSRWLRRG